MPEESPSLPSADEFFDQAPSGLLVLALSGQILRVNKTFCNWVGASAQDVVHVKKLQDFFTMGGRIYHQTHWMPMLEMQGSLSEVKFEVRSANGRIFPVLLNAVRHKTDDGGYDLVTVVSARERGQYEKELLHARKAADEALSKERATQLALLVTQARLQQAMQLGAVFFWDVDPSTRKRRYGDEVARLLGRAEPGPVSEDAFLSAMHPEDRLACQVALEDALRDVHPYHATYRLKGLDGVQRIVVATAQGFMDESGKIAEMVGTLVDVTESHRLRETAEDRALFAEQMVGIVSHDLRTPLQTVLLSSHVLLRTIASSDEKSLRMLGAIDRATRRAQRLISDLLDFTAARVGRGLSVQRRPMNIHEVVSRVVEELSNAYPDAVFRHDRLGEGEVTADADRLAQLIGNLVGNAVTYGEQGQPVTISSAIEEEGVTIGVHNFGNPIPVHQQREIFEPMVRGGEIDNSVRSVGLGLFIVRAIAVAHDGNVEVRSVPVKGTEFLFTFRR